jgi:hypothetical protein
MNDNINMNSTIVRPVFILIMRVPDEGYVVRTKLDIYCFIT